MVCNFIYKCFNRLCTWKNSDEPILSYLDYDPPSFYEPPDILT